MYIAKQALQVALLSRASAVGGFGAGGFFFSSAKGDNTPLWAAPAEAGSRLHRLRNTAKHPPLQKSLRRKESDAGKTIQVY